MEKSYRMIQWDPQMPDANGRGEYWNDQFKQPPQGQPFVHPVPHFPFPHPMTISYMSEYQPYPHKGYDIISYEQSSHPQAHHPMYTNHPWRPQDKSYPCTSEGLTDELRDFHEYIKPSSEQSQARDDIVARMRAVIHEEWPNATVEIFGSYRTGLYLPNGDIDIVIKGSYEDIPPLFDLERVLEDKQIGLKSSFRVLEKARVPLIKFVALGSNIRVDVAFNQHNCVEAADFVKKCCKDYPPMTQLILVLKQYLSQRSLNEVFQGGLSSYSLTLLILSFFQHHPDKELVRSDNANIGSLLLDFLELYGTTFKYDEHGIRVKGEGSLVNKEELKRSIANSCTIAQLPSHNMLCIEDPLTPGNDVARSTYNYRLVKNAFASAHQELSRIMNPKNYSVSILSGIIQIHDVHIQHPRPNVTFAYYPQRFKGPIGHHVRANPRKSLSRKREGSDYPRINDSKVAHRVSIANSGH